MTSEERRENRYRRRRAKREEKRRERCEAIGGIDTALSYNELFKAGKRCCNGVRWKHSVQRFELHLFSGTAIRRKQIAKGQYRFDKYVHFLLNERGKTRPIDAPRVQDRQVQKAFTRNVLLPLYRPSMIWNNGASLEGKGFQFSLNMLKSDLRRHFRKYGRNGYVILIDFKQFFPSASHDELYHRHQQFITDERLKAFGDSIVMSVKGDIGMPLGVEASQAEMIALPSPLDNHIKCQLSIKGFGHYMDDYYIIVPPDREPKKILEVFVDKATALGLHISHHKTQIVPLTRRFRYCKARFYLTETGRVIMNCNRDAMKRDRRKIKAFGVKVANKEMSYEDLWTSTNGMLAYLENYNDHTKVLKLRRLFYSIFGFSAEHIENFRQRSLRNEVSNT